MLIQLFSPNGRATRLGFFLTAAISAAVEFCLIFALASTRQQFSTDVYYLVIAAASAPFAWVQVCVVIRRLTDTGIHWLWALPVTPMCLWSLWALVDAETSSVAALVLSILALYSAILFLLLSLYREPNVMLPAPPPPPPSVPAPAAGPQYVTCPNGHFYEAQRGSCPFCVAVPPPPQVQPLPPPAPLSPTVPIAPIAPTVAISTVQVNPNNLAGWLVVIEGPGRGTEYRINTRPNDLSLGDPESPQVYAVVSYDPANSSCVLLPGNVPAELNGHAITLPAPLQLNDRIKVGSTTLIFVPFAGVYHRWEPLAAQQGVTVPG